jgi:hypothetical protein
MNKNINRCGNTRCINKDKCIRFIHMEEFGIWFIIEHQGRCEKCKDFIEKKVDK